jgi:hypothetical protein
MSEAAVDNRDANKAYYTTSYRFGTSTTSTAALMVWKTLTTHLAERILPMTGKDLAEQTGVPIEQIASVFSQAYYQRHYGFRRFETLKAWESWAKQSGVLYVPELHDPKPKPEVEEIEDMDEEMEE